MRAANITAGVAVAAWFALALTGRGFVGGVVARGSPGYPNSGQIEYYLVWPMFATMAVLAIAWVCNAFGWPKALLTASVVALFALPIYLLPYSGGV
jgi:hypothetical protein